MESDSPDLALFAKYVAASNCFEFTRDMVKVLLQQLLPFVPPAEREMLLTTLEQTVQAFRGEALTLGGAATGLSDDDAREANQVFRSHVGVLTASLVGVLRG